MQNVRVGSEWWRETTIADVDGSGHPRSVAGGAGVFARRPVGMWLPETAVRRAVRAG